MVRQGLQRVGVAHRLAGEVAEIAAVVMGRGAADGEIHMVQEEEPELHGQDQAHTDPEGEEPVDVAVAAVLVLGQVDVRTGLGVASVRELVP